MIYVVLCILLICSAFFSSLETGLLSLGHVRIKKWAAGKIKALETWVKDPAGIVAGILIGNNIVNISFSALFTILVTRLVLSWPGREPWTEMISIIGSAILLLTFGEVLPKTFANTHPDKIVQTFYKPFMKFYKSAKILSNILNKIAFTIVGVAKGKKEKVVSRKELDVALEEIETSGVLEEEPSKMLKKVLGLSVKTVGELMVPRNTIYSVDLTWEYDKIMDVLLKSPYSRIPAYEEVVDEIKGVIYIKDVIGQLVISPKVDFRKIMREPYITYPGRNGQHLFHEFRSKRTHCAVVESHERVIGFITIEDLIEEVVGDIYDEYDHRIYTA
jgi:CBS domain containing-hemolysin-like protein